MEKTKFKMTLVQGGGDSFAEAMKNLNNEFDIKIDQVLFKVGQEDEEGEQSIIEDGLEQSDLRG